MEHVTVFYVERFDPATNKYEELEIEITASVTEHVAAKISGPPENCSPAEGGEIEINSAVCNDPNLKHLFSGLTKDEELSVKQMIDEEFEDHDYDADSDYCDDDYYDIDRDYNAD